MQRTLTVVIDFDRAIEGLCVRPVPPAGREGKLVHEGVEDLRSRAVCKGSSSQEPLLRAQLLQEHYIFL